jgi:hypothetical protein
MSASQAGRRGFESHRPLQIKSSGYENIRDHFFLRIVISETLSKDKGSWQEMKISTNIQGR